MTKPAIRAFTLIETLVAISILTITMVAPFYAIQQSLSASNSARDVLVANMLAQEGIEYAMDIRDNNYLATYYNSASTQSWLYGLDGSTTNGNTSPYCFSPNKCVVDPTQQTTQVCNGSCPALYLNASNAYNQNSIGTATRFTRWIQLTSINAHEAQITTTVTWTSNHKTYTTNVVGYLQNWLPQ